MSRVLLVDDERNVLDAMLRLLKMLKLPCEGETASSCDDALTRVRQGDIDVVISDVNMPNSDGMSLLRQIRSEPSTCRIPVIMLTGSLEPETKRRALEMGATDFINKPVDPGEFAARLRSVLQLKAYEDQLREQNKVLEQQVVMLQRMENLGFLASGIVHDLNNILAGVMGHAQMVIASLNDESKVRRHIDQALEASEQAAALVRQVLTIGRRSSEHRYAQDLGEVVDRAIGLFNVSVPSEVNLVWKRPDHEIICEVDAGQINQVVMNLCINALHAMEVGGTLSVSLERASANMPVSHISTNQPRGSVAHLVVADTGTGMTDDIKARIFEPLFTTKGPGHGTGLGLSVVRRIVDEHGGSITVESTVGMGTTFHLFLPLSGSTAPRPGDSAVQAPARKQSEHDRIQSSGPGKPGLSE
jgi:signal transduction histidine kinase